MLEAALRWPRRGEDWAKTVLIGGVLVFATVFVIPGLILYGYLLEAFGAALQDREEPPSFRGWGALLIDGLLVVVVALAYGLVPIVLFLVGATAIGVGVVGEGGPGAAGGALGLSLLLLTALAGLAVAYVLPAALVRLAERRSVAAAFDLRALSGVVLTGEYAAGWAVAALVAVVGGAVAGALAPVLVGFFVQFYVLLAVVHVVGRGYAGATGG